MKNITLIFLALSLFLIIGCSSDLATSEGLESFDSSSSSSASSSATGGSSEEGEENNSGLITAGEWNDLENWDFWTEIKMDSSFLKLNDHWGIYPDHRVSIEISSGSNPVANAVVELKQDTETIWSTMTDNLGRAELWVNINSSNRGQLSEELAIFVDGEKSSEKVVLYAEGGTIKMQANNKPKSNKVELSFIVDATGSMGDELEFLKDDLESVIEEVQSANSSLEISTSAVFYRDTEDEYLTRESVFTDKFSTTLNFIKEQFADGGGDYPEAVHSGLSKAIEDFQWSSNAITKIAFLILDAPPHHDPQIIYQLKSAILTAAKKGIKIVPITASGIDKDTELLMRYMAILTNSTYVFITNDSGIGNDHITASVGEYEVEYLNDLMIRLIGKYSE